MLLYISASWIICDVSNTLLSKHNLKSMLTSGQRVLRYHQPRGLQWTVDTSWMSLESNPSQSLIAPTKFPSSSNDDSYIHLVRPPKSHLWYPCHISVVSSYHAYQKPQYWNATSYTICQPSTMVAFIACRLQGIRRGYNDCANPSVTFSSKDWIWTDDLRVLSPEFSWWRLEIRLETYFLYSGGSDETRTRETDLRKAIIELCL